MKRRRTLNRFEFTPEAQEVLLTLDGDRITSGPGSHNLANRRNSSKDYATMRKQLIGVLVINQGRITLGHEAWQQMGQEEDYSKTVFRTVFKGISHLDYKGQFIFGSFGVSSGVDEYFVYPKFQVALVEALPEGHPATSSPTNLNEPVLNA